jgi:hypothetical protein
MGVPILAMETGQQLNCAFGDNGTRCSRRDFIRAAGMTQV